MVNVHEQLASLGGLDPADLRTEWQRLYKAEPPRLSAELLRRGIAYKLQERAFGRVGKRVLRSLVAGPSAPSIKPGTRFVREWRGRLINVLADECGYVFEGERYRSLSAIARAVTGVAWSGPRFFGIDR